MSKQETAKRYILLIISLFFSAFGVAFTRHGALGVSPISSVANVLSLKFESISLGTWLIIWNGLLIVGQALILRKNFKLIELLQIPVSFLFGYFTDIGMLCVQIISAQAYAVRLALVLLGTVVLGFGISLSVIANVVMNSGEAFVKAVAMSTHKEFGNIKIGFDISCVIMSVLLSLVFFRFRVVGTREGTLIAAMCTGLVVKFFTARLKKPLEDYLTK